ncbi:EDD domain protein, DegV family [Haloechinothrix alba]|uniref:EDD domain protein, DegV family n=1 Tax=Haloechinothrix alba TaxID=664784 RepID=A0A238XIZ3_9PSEU|nr:DegV family protein [Haloechinothrix alba]SNR58966.1 EDD domain protein, DegV family [Haloechinothrix alba]
MPVAVVTDSTAQLPAELAEHHAITVVPLYVLIDDTSWLDGHDVGSAELAAALRRKSTVTTSMPTSEELAHVYRQALDGGADAVVSVHISAELSGTWGAAVRAAGQVDPDRVRVVDARTTTMGLGFAAIAAAQASAAGGGAGDVEAAAVSTAARSRTVFAVETLEYLRRGGRIGSAAAFFGTALAVKPLLHIEQGRIVPLEKVRTMGRAVSRLVDLAAEAAGPGRVELAVHHFARPERAEQVARQLRERLPNAERCVVTELGAVIGAHTGPGALGIVVQRHEDG